MSKYSKTMMNHEKKCLGKIKNIIMHLVIYGLTHEEFLIMRKEELFKSNSWERLPRIGREYLMGYLKSSLDHLYRFDLIWLHFIDNEKAERVFYETFEAIPRNKLFKSGHFWKNSRKTFSLSKDENILP